MTLESLGMLGEFIGGWNHMWATLLDEEDSIAVYHRMRRGEELQGD